MSTGTTTNPILTCADCGEFFREHECGERVEAIRDDARGQCAIVRSMLKTCPYCASEEVGDAEIDEMYEELRSVKATLRSAEHKLVQSQMAAGGFQTEALFLRQELDALKAEGRMKRYEIVGLTLAELQRCCEALGITLPEDEDMLVYLEVTSTLYVGEIEEAA